MFGKRIFRDRVSWYPSSSSFQMWFLPRAHPIQQSGINLELKSFATFLRSGAFLSLRWPCTQSFVRMFLSWLPQRQWLLAPLHYTGRGWDMTSRTHMHFAGSCCSSWRLPPCMLPLPEWWYPLFLRLPFSLLKFVIIKMLFCLLCHGSWAVKYEMAMTVSKPVLTFFPLDVKRGRYRNLGFSFALPRPSSCRLLWLLCANRSQRGLSLFCWFVFPRLLRPMMK